MNIAPAEGSLDREQFLRLVDHLAATSPAGHELRCAAFHAMCAAGVFDEPVVCTGALKELVDLYDGSSTQTGISGPRR